MAGTFHLLRSNDLIWSRLVHDCMMGELARREPALAKGRVVVAHLDSGASLCGLEGGISRDTSMGFSALDGIPTATRCGALDPGLLLHLLAQGGYDAGRLEDLLYRRSGLLGVSGIRAGSRELLDSDRPEALDLFCFRIAGETARLAAILGGLDAIVFTAGIGEHQPSIRVTVAERLACSNLTKPPTRPAQRGSAATAPVLRLSLSRPTRKP